LYFDGKGAIVVRMFGFTLLDQFIHLGKNGDRTVTSAGMLCRYNLITKNLPFHRALFSGNGNHRIRMMELSGRLQLMVFNDSTQAPKPLPRFQYVCAFCPTTNNWIQATCTPPAITSCL